MNEAQSTILSKSNGSTDRSSRLKGILNGELSKFDNIFPIFESMYKRVHVWPIISYICTIFYILQLILYSFWALNMEKFNYDDPAVKTLTMIIYIFLNLNPYDPFTPTVGNFFIYGIIFVIMILVIIANYIYYRKKMTTSVVLLFIIKVFLEDISLACILPSFIFGGQSLVAFINGNVSGIYIVYTLLTLIMSTMFLGVFLINNNISTSSIFITKSHRASFFPFPMRNIAILGYITSILQFFAELFPYWTNGVCAILHMAVSFYISNDMKYLPFLKFSTNVIFSATLMTCGCCDIARAVQILAINIWDGIVMVVAVVAFFGFSIFAYFYYKRLERKSVELMTPLPDETLDRDKQLLEKNLGDTSDKFLFHYVISLRNASPYFTDMSIVRYALDNFPDNFNVLRVLTLTLAFFPTLSGQLSMCYNRLVKKQHLDVAERFLIVSISRIKLLRLASSGAGFNEKMIAVKQESRRCLNCVRGFWLSTPDTVSAFLSLNKMISQTTAHWTEFTHSYPNAQKTFDEYSTYLIECATDFQSAAIQHHFLSLLDEGHRLHKDMSFRSFIWWHPFYLKRGIVDFKGVLRESTNLRMGNGNGSQGRTSSNGSSHQSSTLSVGDVVELALEEEDMNARVIIKQHKLRLALQKSLANRKGKCASGVLITILISFVLSTAAALFLKIFFETFFSQRESAVIQLRALNEARYFQSVSRLSNYLYAADNTNRLFKKEELEALQREDGFDNNNLDMLGPLQRQSIYYQQLGSDRMATFIQKMVDDASDGKNIYEYGQAFLTRSINLTTCDATATPLPLTRFSSLKALYAFVAVQNSRLFYREPSTWDSEKVLCEIANVIFPMSNGYSDFYTRELDVEVAVTKQNKRSIVICEYVLPATVVVINLIMIMTTFGLYGRELAQILKVFANASSSLKDMSCDPIRKNTDDEPKSTAAIPIGCTIQSLYVALVVLCIIPLAVLVALTQIASDTNQGYERIADWMNLGSCRPAFISEVLEHLILGILFRNSPFTDIDKQHRFTNLMMIIAQAFNSEVLDGGEVISIVGFDDMLDDIQFKEACKLNYSSESIHGNYRCASLEQSFALFKTLVDQSLNILQSIDSLDDAMILEIFHIANQHIFDGLNIFNERLEKISIEYNKDFVSESQAITIIGVILFVVILALELLILNQFNQMYSAAMTLLRRVPPIQIMQNQDMFDMFMPRQSNSFRGAYSHSQNIIFSSDDGALFLSKTGIIELVNPSVQHILGYVPDQILGQNITQIFAKEESDKIHNQIEMMKNGESTDVFEGSARAVTDSATLIHCSIKIVGMRSGPNSELSSFVVFIKDDSEIIQKQQFAEAAKRKSEELLFQILPRDVVNKLNMGEKDITIVIPSATVMFIDIVRFSEYASHLTPQQIMGNLSLIFDSFDKCLAHYPLVTKIKLIGDVYMCAAGLFSPEEPPAAHAEQMIRFALDCLSEIENANAQLEAMLSVRIGVNTGGPLIAGVLGTDKPVFDIIGDTINVAARLQSTDIPGKIQIPDATYELIRNLEFSTEMRGEVYLKGKGYTNTYLISPQTIMMQGANTLTDFDTLLGLG